MCFPPHTSHCLQLADKSLFKSLKTHWTLEGLQYTRDHGGVKVGKKNFYKIFNPAWEKSSTVENMQSGFRATGMFPVNFKAVPEVAYTPSLTTDQCVEETTTSSLQLQRVHHRRIMFCDKVISQKLWTCQWTNCCQWNSYLLCQCSKQSLVNHWLLPSYHCHRFRCLDYLLCLQLARLSSR